MTAGPVVAAADGSEDSLRAVEWAAVRDCGDHALAAAAARAAEIALSC